MAVRTWRITEVTGGRAAVWQSEHGELLTLLEDEWPCGSQNMENYSGYWRTSGRVAVRTWRITEVTGGRAAVWQSEHGELLRLLEDEWPCGSQNMENY